MAFTDAEKVDIRRHCGYPMYGDQPTQDFGYRYLRHYQTLEFRMQHPQPAEETLVRSNFIANCNTLETALVGSSANLDTDQAAVWKHNKNEVRDRDGLYSMWRKKLCDFFGVPPGPGFKSGVTFVV